MSPRICVRLGYLPGIITTKEQRALRNHWSEVGAARSRSLTSYLEWCRFSQARPIHCSEEVMICDPIEW